MTDTWQHLVHPVIGTPNGYVETVLERWPRETTAPPHEVPIDAICGTFQRHDPLDNWPANLGGKTLLQNGIYSPLQLLTWQIAKRCTVRIDYENPFLFSLIGTITGALLRYSIDSSLRNFPLDVEEASAPYRRALQAVFRLREQREEGEPLSIEIRLPLSGTPTTTLELKPLAQVFGRGVSITHGDQIVANPTPIGGIDTLFEDGKGSPSARLYKLDTPFPLIPEKELRLILRRDGLVTLAANANPLFDFYDGGWHAVDLLSGLAAIETLRNATFPNDPAPDGFMSSLVNLAYHMASHWHGGIIALLLPGDIPQVMEDPSETSLKVSKVLSDKIAGGNAPAATPVAVSAVKEKGLGRALLTTAIQDGAVVFHPNGSFDSAGRIVESLKAMKNVGTGHRAAKAIAQLGVAIKISHDGGIKVFAERGGAALTPEAGLRIR